MKKLILTLIFPLFIFSQNKSYVKLDKNESKKIIDLLEKQKKHGLRIYPIVQSMGLYVFMRNETLGAF